MVGVTTWAYLHFAGWKRVDELRRLWLVRCDIQTPLYGLSGMYAADVTGIRIGPPAVKGVEYSTIGIGLYLGGTDIEQVPPHLWVLQSKGGLSGHDR